MIIISFLRVLHFCIKTEFYSVYEKVSCSVSVQVIIYFQKIQEIIGTFEVMCYNNIVVLRITVYFYKPTLMKRRAYHEGNQS